MANVTTGKNFPTPYDLRMEGLNKTPGISPASAKPTANIGKVGGIFRSLGGIGKELAIRAGTGGLLGTNELNMLRGAAGKGVSYLGKATANAAPFFGGGGAATAIGIPALAGAVAGPILDMVFPRAVNAGEEAELQKLRGGPRNFGRDYKNRELAAGQAAENFRTGAGFPGQSPAAERAYQGEMLRTAQLAAQSPEMLAWAAQREKDLKSKDYSKSEDMGMRIWAQKYGPGSKNDLASKVKPGQAGYDVIQEVIKGKAAPSAAAAPATTAYNPFAINAYSSNFKLPGMEEYANSMQGAIVRSPGIMPSYAQDNPMLGDYNSTINQGYNLSFPIVPTTTVNTNSAAMGAALYTPNSSVQAMGNFAGPTIKIPIGNTPFGATGYPAFTAGALLPNITKEQIFGPKAEGKFNAMFSANR